MFEVIEVHPAGDERVVSTHNTYASAKEHAEALQEDEFWFMYNVRETKNNA
jgi:hypothetical protein